ncbi:MAG: response regulator [Gammaproteobacteria bacterium]|nr:response regulator [Gammaproteobacteria bacterium]
MIDIDIAGSRILIVDDELQNIDVIKRLLMLDGYNLSFASDGVTALRLVRKKPPDLILLDIMMAGMDGFTVLSSLKNDDKTRHVPVVFLTAVPDDEHKRKGLEPGAVNYIEKPVKRERLCGVIAQTLLSSKQNQLIEAQAIEIASLKQQLAELQGRERDA